MTAGLFGICVNVRVLSRWGIFWYNFLMFIRLNQFWKPLWKPLAREVMLFSGLAIAVVFAALAAAPHAAADDVDLDSGDRFEVFDIFNPTSNADRGAFRTRFEDAEADGVSPVAVILVRAANFMVRVGGVIALLVLVLGALLFITSQGRENQIQQGKDVFFFGFVGLLVILFSYLIGVVVQAIFFP